MLVKFLYLIAFTYLRDHKFNFMNHTLLPLLKRIGDRLHELRHSRREKLIAIEMALGINHGTVSEIEHGKYTSLSLATVAKFADYYGVSVESLIMP